MSNTPIDWSSSIKYLSKHLNYRLSFFKHIKHGVNRTKSIRTLLYTLINCRFSLSLNLKFDIYKAYICPIVNYASPARAFNLSTRAGWLSNANNSWSYHKFPTNRSLPLMDPSVILRKIILAFLRVPKLLSNLDLQCSKYEYKILR